MLEMVFATSVTDVGPNKPLEREGEGREGEKRKGEN